MVLVVDVVFQFPNRDFIAGCGAGCEVGREPVDLPAMLVEPENRDGPAVLLLVDPPNTEAVLLVLEIVEAAFALARDGGCPKPVAAVASPKMGLKFWTGGLLSEADVAEVVVVVVVAVTAKMGLKPEAISGLVLLTDAELLAGAAVTAAELDVEEAEEALTWLATPNRLAIGGVLLAAWET